MAARITIIESQARWPAEFVALKGLVKAAVPAGGVIHHIGSTAVPGLAAKDVIDLQLTVADLAAFDDAGLCGDGFLPLPHLSDHCPAGMDLPTADLAKRFYRGPARPANLHVRQVGRFNQRYALLCRDYLRAHPAAAASYGQIKRCLATQAPTDPDFYYAIKDPVSDLLMTGAEHWARATGWLVPPGD